MNSKTLIGDSLMSKIVIAISDGVASVVSRPDDVEVEIRDYDVDGFWDEDNQSCKVDEENDRYQEIIFPAEKKNNDNQELIYLSPVKEEPDEPILFNNFYKCPCGTEWDNEDSCTCNDRCPNCNKEIEPYKSERV
jgi:hypothetical protein